MSSTGPTPQFNTAEYSSTGEVCKSCKQPIGGSYYRINGMLACERCAEQVRQQSPKDTHSAFARGVMLGIVAAIVGMFLYAGFEIATTMEFALAAVGVGYLIGKAMKIGSAGIGGRRYQITAAVLTYAAVSVAAVPVALYQHFHNAPAAQTEKAPATAAGGQAVPGVASDQTGENEATTAAPNKHKISYLALAGRLILLGLASPFMELQESLSGIIGLVILFAGMSFAWKLTAGPKLEILGPFPAGSGALPTSAT